MERVLIGWFPLCSLLVSLINFSGCTSASLGANDGGVIDAGQPPDLLPLPDQAGTCPSGFHNGGDGDCLIIGTCSPGYHDNGLGACVLLGNCADGYYDNGLGACIAAGCAVGYHDGGGGDCVATGTCSPGYFDDGTGLCGATACAATYHPGGDGSCLNEHTCACLQSGCSSGFHDDGTATGSCLASGCAPGFHDDGTALCIVGYSTPYVWVASRNNNSVTKLRAADGYVIGTYSVGTDPQGVAVDASGNAWVANSDDNTVTRLNGSDGTTLGVYPVGNHPIGLAIDASGNVWTPNYFAATVTKLNGADGSLIGTYNVGGGPQYIAVDASGNVWVANQGGGTVSKLRATDGYVVGTYSVGSAPMGVGIDTAGNVWVANEGDNSVTKLRGTDGHFIDTHSVGGGPRGLAIDASGDIWTANGGDRTVTKLSGTNGAVLGTYSVGNSPQGINVDAYGNVWVSNSGDSTVTELRAVDGYALGTYPVGGGADSFGDMTGFKLQYVVLGGRACAATYHPGGDGDCLNEHTCTCLQSGCSSGFQSDGTGACVTDEPLHCKAILDAQPSSPSGVYTIDPDGPAGPIPPLEVYCDMVDDDGGWTLVVGIEANQNHLNSSAVTPQNLVSPTGKGKFSDTVINAIKQGSSPAFRFTCANVTAYFQATCQFSASTTASGACTGESYSYPPASYGTAQYSQEEIACLADGSNGTNNRLAYGDLDHPEYGGGCATEALFFPQVGSVWVR